MEPFEVIELRRYALRPGKREDLIALFDREFIETQEACGMVPIGHYRDLDDPNSFVWFRGFPQYELRKEALEAFYVRSEAWARNRDAANATMVDSDNVLLLHEARPESGFNLDGLTRPAFQDGTMPRFVAASIVMLESAADESFIHSFEERVLPKLHGIADRVAYFVTDDRPNEFPRLPVREGECAFVAIGACRTRDGLDKWIRAFTGLPCETLRLEAAPRSLYR